MNVTLSLDDKLVKEARKMAVEQDTTLTGLIRDQLQKLVGEASRSGRRRREREALERSFKRFSVNAGPRTWKREDLYDRH